MAYLTPRHRQPRQTIPDVAKSKARYGRAYCQSSPISSCGGARDGGSTAASGCRTCELVCARIYSITSSSSMLAMILTELPHFGQVSTSIRKTRRSRCAQVIG